MTGRKRLLRAVSRTRTFCAARIATITSAVTVLRNTTAVATSTPLLNAMRAATWLAPIISAISSSVPKAAPLIARAGAGIAATSVEPEHARVQAGQAQQCVSEGRGHAGHLAQLLDDGDQRIDLHRLARLHV